MNGTLMIGVTAWLALSGQVPLRTMSDTSWAWSAQLSVSLVPSDAEWSIAHPIHGGAGTTWETFTGTFRHRVHVQAHLELRRKYVGIRGILGILPQEFIQVSPVQRHDLTLVLAGLSAVFYPIAGAGGNVILAFLTEPEPVQAILRHVGLPTTPPPLSPARGPPQHDLGFDREPDLDLDQTPAFDTTEPVPDFDDVDPDGGA